MCRVLNHDFYKINKICKIKCSVNNQGNHENLTKIVVQDEY
jgi:hypothetical protein